MKKSLKTFCAAIAVVVLLLPALCACNGAGGTSSSGRDTLTIYNWEDYIDKTLLSEFETYYRDVTGRSLSITYTTFDTNETMMTKVLENDANVDLICPSEYAIEKLLVAGKLENHNDLLKRVRPELDKIAERKANAAEGDPIKDFDPTFAGMSSLTSNGDGKIEGKVMDAIRLNFSSIEGVAGKEGAVDMTQYMVPYMYGTLGILYNKDVISEEELDKYGWGVLWNVENNEKLENKILMKDSVRDTYVCALFYMYEYDLVPEKYKGKYKTAQELINVTDDEMLEAAEKILTEQREHIAGYEVDFGKDDMLNNLVYADFAWSGDALWAVEESWDDEREDYRLGYYCPFGVSDEGRVRYSNIFYDGWVIPTTVKNPLAALMFLDYICRPEKAIRNSVEIGYTCAVAKQLLMENDEVAEYLAENDYDVDEYYADEGRFPEINEYLGVMRDFGAKNEALVNMWQRAKSGDGVDMSLLIVLAVIIGGIALAIGIYFLADAARLRPRKLRDSDDKTE